MRRMFLVATLLLGVSSVQSLPSQTLPARAAPRSPAEIPDEFDPPPDFPPDPPRRQAAEPLPKPSMREPFAIGEALNDPARVPDAVMSLLALMNVGVVTNDTPMQPVQAPMRLRLTESEVRRLIEMGVADAEAVAGIHPDAETFTFKDLHASLAPMLRGISVDRLAQIYSEYYATHDDALVGQVLQGQPIEPETPLMRTQMWLMLADAVIAPAPRRAAALDGPRLVRASSVLQRGGGSTWGAGTLLPDRRPLASQEPRFSDAEWQEIVVRLNLLGRDGFTITPSDGLDLHEGHGGPGAPAVFRGKLVQSAPPLVSSVTGRVLLTPRPGGATGLAAHVTALDLENHGTWNVAEGGTVAFDASGSMQPISFTPKMERARTRTAPIVWAGGVLAVRVPSEDLLNALYTLPAVVQKFGWGTGVATAILWVSWHPVDAIDVVIHNFYNIPNLLFGGPFVAGRFGDDWAKLTLERQDDGTYQGSGVLASKSTIVLRGKQCSGGNWVNQRVSVIGSQIPRSGGAADGFFSDIQPPLSFTWRPGEQAAEYLRLEFTPASKPVWMGGKDPCQDEIQKVNAANYSDPYFIPLNDARWTVGQGSGVQLAIPDRGPLHYKQLTISGADPLSSVIPFSTWTFSVQRVREGR